MRYLRSIMARIRAWRLKKQPRTFVGPSLLLSFGPSFGHSFGPAIHRDVTPNGVRVYSLCGNCGARLECSATLCEECARVRGRSGRPSEKWGTGTGEGGTG